MLGKILHFRRSEPVQEPEIAGPDPDLVTADNAIVSDLLADAGLVEVREPVRRSTPAVTRQFLDMVMGECVYLYKLDGRDPPRRLKLETLHERYLQLRPQLGWPMQDRSSLAKQLCALGCRSERETVGGQKVRFIAFPPYPAHELPKGWDQK